MIVIDFETRSRADLKLEGADKYCASPSTEVICLAWQHVESGDHGYERFVGNRNGWLCGRLETLLLDTDELVAAHNARFDQLIYEYIMTNDHGFPPIARNRWYCTSAQARVNGLPAALGDATRALDTSHKKDFKGAQLIKKLCIPQPDGAFNEDPHLLKEMVTYCIDDVSATVDLVKATRNLTDREHVDWLVNERINDRGIKIDRGLATLCSSYAAEEAAIIGAEIGALTAGAATKATQHKRIKDFVLPRLSHDHALVCVKHVNGVKKTSLDKQIRSELLARADAGEFMDDGVYNLIAALDDGNKSSVSKYKAMLNRVMDDDKVRGSFVYAGAGTIRYSSRGLQLHNMKRDCLSVADTEGIKGIMSMGHKMTGDIMDQLAKMMRPTLIADEGHELIVGDWSSIESRAMAFLSGDKTKLASIEQGADQYIRAAEDIGETDRQLGKVIDLSLGYGGGPGALAAMARSFGMKIPEHLRKRYVKKWRASNPVICQFWYDLQALAVKAMRTPGHQYAMTNGVSYTFKQDLMGGSLICTLPDGTQLTYPQARLELDKFDKWGITALKAAFTMKQDATEWPRHSLWHGLLAENVAQAYCASLLRDALKKAPSPVLHCHDEIVLTAPKDKAASCAATLQNIMETPPDWAKGLPLKAEPKIVTRYGK